MRTASAVPSHLSERSFRRREVEPLESETTAVVRLSEHMPESESADVESVGTLCRRPASAEVEVGAAVVR